LGPQDTVKFSEGSGLVWLVDQHRAQRDCIDGVIVDPGKFTGRCVHEPAAVQQSALRG
jgi:hypothetical protein